MAGQCQAQDISVTTSWALSLQVVKNSACLSTCPSICPPTHLPKYLPRMEVMCFPELYGLTVSKSPESLLIACWVCMALHEANPQKLSVFSLRPPHFLQISSPWCLPSCFELCLWVRSCRTCLSLWHSSIHVPWPIGSLVRLRFLHPLALWLGSQSLTRRHSSWSHTAPPFSTLVGPTSWLFWEAVSMRVKTCISLKSISLQVFWEVGRRMIQLVSFEAPPYSSIKAIPPYPSN